MRYRRTAMTLPAMAIVATAATVAAPMPAQAAARDGNCAKSEFCYYYNSNTKGSVSDFTKSVGDYGAKQPSCYEFRGRGKGKDICVKNHAASVWNRTSKTVRVYFNSNYGGTSQSIKPGARANLKPGLKNNNASHRIGGKPTSEKNLSYALYQRSGGRITAGFDGYKNTSGRHEGIDIARSINSPVRALVKGKVTNVARGSTGRSGLSTIAVYNAKYNKTVIYLHTKPLAGLRTGQNVSRGQRIASESWRGIISSSSAHTHVEMRPGRQTHASVSVGDPHLDNPNPTTFWHARGYRIR